MFSSMWNVMATNDVRIVSDWSHLHCIVCDKLMVNAYIVDCGCQFCKLCLDDYLKEGARLCPAENCHAPSIISDGHFLPDNGANVRISRLNVLCPNRSCNSSMELGEMDEHLRVCESISVECPFSKMGCEGGGDGIIDLNVHLNTENVKHSRLMIDAIERMQNEVMIRKKEQLESQTALREELMSLRNELKMKEDALGRLEEELGNVRVDAKEEKEKYTQEMSDIKDMINAAVKERKWEQNVDFLEPFIWNISNFSNKMKEARKGCQKTWYSDVFFTHNGGYAIRLHLMPNGYGDRLGTHLCVGFQIMRGVNDDALTWPFEKTVSISLVEHSSQEDRCVRKYNVTSTLSSRQYVFNKPENIRNHGHGDNDVIAINDLLRNRCLLVKDTLIIRCSTTS